MRDGLRESCSYTTVIVHPEASSSGDAWCESRMHGRVVSAGLAKTLRRWFEVVGLEDLLKREAASR